jgi:hypothetical protein
MGVPPVRNPELSWTWNAILVRERYRSYALACRCPTRRTGKRSPGREVTSWLSMFQQYRQWPSLHFAVKTAVEAAPYRGSTQGDRPAGDERRSGKCHSHRRAGVAGVSRVTRPRRPIGGR